LPARPRKNFVFGRLFGSGFAGLGICFSTAYPANGQDKHALVQKLIEVTELSNQIKVGAQTAATPIMD
jgi:hypothetical protein